MKKIVLSHIQDDFTIYSGGEYDTLTPDTIQDYISQVVLNLSEHTIMWVLDLQLYGKDFIKTLYHMGYKDQTMSNPSVKDMSRRGFKYVVSDKGVYYCIIVRTGKHTLYIYNVNNLLSNLSPSEIIKTWGHGRIGETGQVLAASIHDGVEMLHGWQSKKTPYTVSMVASREWKDIEGLYKCDNLVNCKDRQAPNGETLEKYLRKSYWAGWNYLNPVPRKKYQNRGVKVYDVNSLYPFMAGTKPLPWGEPVPFTGSIPGEIVHDDSFYYFVRVKIQFDLKKDSFPYIQKRGDLMYRLCDYLSTSDIITYDHKGRERRTDTIIGMDGKRKEVFPEFVFTKTDWELIQRHYHIRKVEYIDGVYFRTTRCIFKDYVNYFYNIKCNTQDPGTKRVSKMMLNGVIGTLAKRADRVSTIYTSDDGEHLTPIFVKSGNPSPCYIHIGAAILAYAREYIYEAACKNRKHFLYTDTDSLHIYGDKQPIGIELDPVKLGAFKVEHEADDAYYLKRKSYILRRGSEYLVTMAGVQSDYQAMIGDILSGKDYGEIISKAKMGGYGSGLVSAFDDKYSGKWIELPNDPEHEVALIETSPDAKRLQKMIKLVDDDKDRISSLKVIDYPTGVKECEDFKIHDITYWLSQSDRDRLRV